jgi:two-component sensor histidine kinase
VKSIVTLSGRNSMDQFADAVSGRVDALARAHRLLAASNWSNVDLRELLSCELPSSQVVFSGFVVELPARVVQPLCMAIHELAANARDHGALAISTGRLAISWHAADKELFLSWEETGLARQLTEPGKVVLDCLLCKALSSSSLPES